MTERKRLEAELSRTEGYLREALANMADGLVLYDQDGIIRFCNPQYRDLFPKTADLRVVGGRFSDIIRAAVERGEEAPKSDIEAWVDQRIQALRHSGDRLIHLDDGRIIEARSRALAGSDTLVVFNDVTSRQQIRDRTPAQSHARSSDRLSQSGGVRVPAGRRAGAVDCIRGANRSLDA